MKEDQMDYFLILALLFSLFLPGALLAQTAPPASGEAKIANFKKQVDAPRVGKLRVDYIYDEDNEPVSQPASFKIFLQCDGSRAESLVKDVRGCELKAHRYVKEEKILHVDMVYPVIDAGSIVHCERREEVQFDLGKYCADLWKAAPKKKKK
ncbi:MAG: hypothetical protein HC883_06460 [Bdellovibrionaceae bacterium]|nr:hypothetical protein [Pseudobdellovibrionaceae bacterium]